MRTCSTCISAGQLEMTFPDVVVALKNKIAVPIATPSTIKTELTGVSSLGSVKTKDSGAAL